MECAEPAKKPMLNVVLSGSGANPNVASPLSAAISVQDATASLLPPEDVVSLLSPELPHPVNVPSATVTASAIAKNFFVPFLIKIPPILLHFLSILSDLPQFFTNVR